MTTAAQRCMAWRHCKWGLKSATHRRTRLHLSCFGGGCRARMVGLWNFWVRTRFCPPLYSQCMWQEDLTFSIRLRGSLSLQNVWGPPFPPLAWSLSVSSEGLGALLSPSHWAAWWRNRCSGSNYRLRFEEGKSDQDLISFPSICGKKILLNKFARWSVPGEAGPQGGAQQARDSRAPQPGRSYISS